MRVVPAQPARGVLARLGFCLLPIVAHRSPLSQVSSTPGSFVQRVQEERFEQLAIVVFSQKNMRKYFPVLSICVIIS